MFTYNNSSLARKEINHISPSPSAAGIQTVYCSGVVDDTICFRQCAELVKISQETGAILQLTANGKVSVANSILDLLKLQVVKGTYVVLTVQHGDLKSALQRSRKVLQFREK